MIIFIKDTSIGKNKSYRAGKRNQDKHCVFQHGNANKTTVTSWTKPILLKCILQELYSAKSSFVLEKSMLK